MAKPKSIFIQLICTVCKSINYTTRNNPQNAAIKNKGAQQKLTLNKYCKFCRKSTDHKEIKI